jgi:hypothetical protein
MAVASGEIEERSGAARLRRLAFRALVTAAHAPRQGRQRQP